MKKYNLEYARKMVEIVHQNQPNPIGYRDLQRKVGLVDHNRKFDDVMKRLREIKIFEPSNRTRRGPKVPVHLTPQANKKLDQNNFQLTDLFLINQVAEIPTELRLKWPRISNSDLILTAVLVLAAFGSVTEKRNAKPHRGDIMMDDPLDNNRKICFTAAFSKPGTGIDDIIRKRIRPGRNARMLDNRRNSALDELFSYSLVLSRTEAEQLLESLLYDDPPILKKITYENEYRFEIADSNLRQFIEWWVLSIFAVVHRMEYCYLNGKVNYEQDKEFKKWIKKLFGSKSKARERFSNLDYRLSHSPGRSTINHEIDRHDIDILAYQEILYGNSKENPDTYGNRNVQRIYSKIVKPMLKLRYPPFLGIRLEKLKEN